MSSRPDHASGPAAGHASDSVVERRFRGRIMGVGTTSGVRIVVGMWDRSPFGPFTDVFLELPDGTSVLLAPDEIVAAYVSGTYRFDTVSVVDVRARRTAGGLELSAGALQASIDVGGISPLGRILRIVPKPIARDPRWLAAIDPVARLLAPGSGTAGSAGNGRREYYGVTGAHDVTGVRGTWAGEPLGDLAPLDPPVAFGFASMPKIPQVVDVETTIREPA
ncbi:MULTISPECIES: hypothetical protein [Curtobacterium]|jgi:hypothetical protein|uniref:hypothetical protein n=1 Tax=Curtobacterium TaxID=2034 RepID=UPI001BDDD57A|nr:MULTISPECIES: hypothetical protein [Curtobacterium]MBT1608263.1 hypothetical protein [Curtobacterium flaccumfaciens pv. betae]MBT1633191.1 hypothetical protein [Curtobacterium flaccumfaciens pv. oortii]MBT1658188.1 hypothetical protein [Curtobacterium flaccumfaciens pv. betae]MCE0458008.1 hypothetical protein [Curtobacterium allii]MCS0470309.1 hypothetical protein [Curtobacterium flaccumfaciens pv. betae]